MARTVDLRSTIAARPVPQHGGKLGAVSVEPNPNKVHGSTLI
jgi:hypothetical protein